MLDVTSGSEFERACIASDVATLERDGYLILNQLVDETVITRLSVELEPWFSRTPHCVGDFYGWNTTRIGGVLAKAPSLQSLAMHAHILAIADALLKPACDYVQLNLSQAIRVHPGERAQAPHRDEEMWPCDPQGKHLLLNAMWAVTDFTEHNGATRIWPGSHRARLDRAIDPRASIAASMPRGSVLLFLGSTTHAAGANVSEIARDGVIVSYCLGWLKTYENQFLAYPRETARSFPKELQRLIGYRIHRPNLGGWEGQDPICALDNDAKPAAHVDALTPQIEAELRQHYSQSERAGDGD